MTALLCYKRNWFYIEPSTHNPYGMVYRVLKFTAKHDRPLRRSALTFCDDEKPPRIDYCKEKYGGPYSTATVEDVKTFLRVLVMLLAVGPIYVVYVSTIYLFPIFGLHMGCNDSVAFEKHMTCRFSDWVVLQSGNLTYMAIVAFLPAYITLVHPVIIRRYPKILNRLGIGIGLLFFAALSMALIHIGANYSHTSSTAQMNNSGLVCMFNTVKNEKNCLGLHPAYLAIPNMFNSIAEPLLSISILEFISAQSPHTMKGALLGIFYAIRGLFTVIGFSITSPFADGNVRWKTGIIDCGVSYYIMHVGIGFSGLLLFCLMVRWYQFRERDDRPYDPMYVENYYNRYIRQDAATTRSHVVPKRPKNLGINSIYDYGSC
jgi:hypothetical protein